MVKTPFDSEKYIFLPIEVKYINISNSNDAKHACMCNLKKRQLTKISHSLSVLTRKHHRKIPSMTYKIRN